MNTSAKRIEPIKMDTLLSVLSQMHGKNIIHADCQTKPLHGGTLGDVKLVSGIAEAADGEKLPVQVVLKIQKKWERFGDALSWRREHDLFTTDFGKLFTDRLRWPVCYHTEMTGDEIQIWMEYINGVSGGALKPEAAEQAALELGRFQGRLHAHAPDWLQGFTNFSAVDFMKADYSQWKPTTVEYRTIRSEDCAIPRHLRNMLMDMDDNADEIFERIEKLPVVLCHRDFWNENIFYTEGEIVLIDWDTTGWGYMGEDIASLIVDGTEIEYMEEYWRTCVPAYYRGLSEYMDISAADAQVIRTMILLKFGYRFVHDLMFTESPDAKNYHVAALQKIYEMR